MKKGNILLSLPLIFVSLIKLVAAQNWLDNPITATWTWVTSIFALVGPTSWSQLIIVLVVFAIFLFGMQDIISNFTLFSRRTSWVISGSLAIIGSLTGAVAYIARFFIYISLWAGTLSIFVAIITGFIAFAAIHLGSSWIGGLVWAVKRQEYIKAAKKKGADIGSVLTMLEEIKETGGKDYGNVNL